MSQNKQYIKEVNKKMEEFQNFTVCQNNNDTNCNPNTEECHSELNPLEQIVREFVLAFHKTNNNVTDNSISKHFPNWNKNVKKELMNLYRTRLGEVKAKPSVDETNTVGNDDKQNPFPPLSPLKWLPDVCRLNSGSVMAKHLGWVVAWTKRSNQRICSVPKNNDVEPNVNRDQQPTWLQWNDRFHSKMKKKFQLFVQSKRKEIKEQLGKQD